MWVGIIFIWLTMRCPARMGQTGAAAGFIICYGIGEGLHLANPSDARINRLLISDRQASRIVAAIL
jgi:hypothetical protein